MISRLHKITQNFPPGFGISRPRGLRKLILGICLLGFACTSSGEQQEPAPGKEPTGSVQKKNEAARAAVHPRSKKMVDGPCGPGVQGPCVVLVEGGRFLQGAQAESPEKPGHHPAARDDEAPPREVSVEGFWMHAKEVVVSQYGRCIQAGGCRLEDINVEGGYFTFRKPDAEMHPLNGVTWEGARRYCSWIGGRLPTESEWEFAARGPRSSLYPWGDDEPNCARAIYGGPEGSCGVHGTSTYDYANKSSFGVFNMAGSLWEWVEDPYVAKGATVESGARNEGVARVIKGGGWTDEDPNELRASARGRALPQMKLDDLGFRCVRDRDR